MRAFPWRLVDYDGNMCAVIGESETNILYVVQVQHILRIPAQAPTPEVVAEVAPPVIQPPPVVQPPPVIQPAPTIPAPLPPASSSQGYASSLFPSTPQPQYASAVASASQKIVKSPISILNEYCQRRNRPPVVYKTGSDVMIEGVCLHTISAHLTDERKSFISAAPTLKDAKTASAEAVCKYLGI